MRSSPRSRLRVSSRRSRWSPRARRVPRARKPPRARPPRVARPTAVPTAAPQRRTRPAQVARALARAPGRPASAVRAVAGRVHDRDPEAELVRAQGHQALAELAQEAVPFGPAHLLEQAFLVELGQERDVAVDRERVVQHRAVRGDITETGPAKLTRGVFR